VTTIDLARRLRSIRPIRRASSKSNRFLHRTPRYRLAGRIGRRWGTRRTTKRSTVGASLACWRLSMMGRSASSAGRKPVTRGPIASPAVYICLRIAMGIHADSSILS
jgi:hypothetical protein